MTDCYTYMSSALNTVKAFWYLNYPYFCLIFRLTTSYIFEWFSIIFDIELGDVD